MHPPAPDPINLLFWKILSIVGVTLGVIGWLRYFRIGEF